MAERERLIEELENYEPYALHFPHLMVTVDGKLILDVLDFLRSSCPCENPLDSLSEAELMEPMKHFQD